MLKTTTGKPQGIYMTVAVCADNRDELVGNTAYEAARQAAVDAGFVPRAIVDANENISPHNERGEVTEKAAIGAEPITGWVRIFKFSSGM